MPKFLAYHALQSKYFPRQSNYVKAIGSTQTMLIHMHTFRQSGSPTIESKRTQLTFAFEPPPSEEWKIAFALEFLHKGSDLPFGMNIDSFGQDGILAVSIDSVNPEHFALTTGAIQGVTDATNPH